MEAGYCNRKKTDVICEGICDAEVRPRSRSVPFTPARSAGAALFRALPERFLFLAVLAKLKPHVTSFDRSDCSCLRCYFANLDRSALDWVVVRFDRA
jgi:hypothetical protein